MTVSSKISAFISKINGLSSKISTLISKINGLSSKISTIHSAIDTLKQDSPHPRFGREGLWL